MATFSPTSIHTARRRHRCNAECGEFIEPGHRYVKQRGWDGCEAWTFKAHESCAKLYGSLNRGDYGDHEPMGLRDWADECPADVREEIAKKDAQDAPGARSVLAYIARREAEPK